MIFWVLVATDSNTGVENIMVEGGSKPRLLLGRVRGDLGANERGIGRAGSSK